MKNQATFSGYSQEEIVSYVFGAMILRSFVFGEQSREVAQKINTGLFSQYLLKPINYIIYVFIRELPERLWLTFFTLLQLFLLACFLKPTFFWLKDIWLNLAFL